MDNGYKTYLSHEQYIDLLTSIEKFTVIILFSFNKQSTAIRDEIIRNFISKGLTSLRSIVFIWQMGDFENCWSIFRIMLDRLFHLQALFDNDEFEKFEKWSFITRHKEKMDARSDPEFQKLISPDKVKSNIEGMPRFNQLRREKTHWKRPKARDIAKSMDLLYLYNYGYNYASSLIHPMASDGKINFDQIISDKIVYFEEQKGAMQNSFLIQLLLIQKGLNASTLVWRRIVYDFIDDCVSALNNYDEEYKISLKKVLLMEKDMLLCEKRSSSITSI